MVRHLKHSSYIYAISMAVLLTASASYAFVPPSEALVGSPAEDRMYLDTKAPSIEAEGRFQSFKEQHGEGWTGVWNTVTETPHRVVGQGLGIAGSLSESNIKEVTGEFVRDNASFLGVVPQSLHHVSSEHHGGRWYTDYQQVHDGLEVIGGRVHVRIKDDGLVTMFGSDFYPNVDISTAPGLSEAAGVGIAKDAVAFDMITDEVLSSRLVILPAVRGDEATYHLAYEVRLRVQDGPAIWKTYVDAGTGEVLRRINEIRYDTVHGTVTGYYKPMYITDPDTEGPFWCEYMSAETYGEDTTDATGYYSIEVGTGGTRNMFTRLRGDWAVVSNLTGPEAAYYDTVPPGTELNLLWDDANSLENERNAYYHTCVVHDWIKGVDPSFTGVDRITPVRVNETDYCNAYWDGNGITLGAGYGTCNDLAMFADVIYHEYGHAIVDFQYRPFSPSGAMHEAFADYTACTITNESYIGEGVITGGYFRNMSNGLKYPEDLTGEVHDDGRVLGGALWDMRTNLWPDTALSDSLMHFARYGRAENFQDYFWDLLETDDDDGDLSNGTPHYYEIVSAFGAHGIGPGLFIEIIHNKVTDSEVAGVPFPVTATVESNLNLDPDSIVVWYDDGGGWTMLATAPTANPDEYTATIPAQGMGNTVEYYVSARAGDWPAAATHPEGAPATVHSFTVGTDATPPVIAHTALADQPDAEWPVVVAAEVTDNLGIDTVELEYFYNGDAQPALPMAKRLGTDIYEVPLDLAPVPGDFIEYRIKAVDASGAQHVTYEPEATYVVFGVLDAHDFAFETGEEGWTHMGAAGWTDQWHLSTQRDHTSGGGSSWKCGDTGAGDYAGHQKAFLESPVVTLGEDARLSFWYWIDAEAYEPLTGSGLAWDGVGISLVDSAGVAMPIDPIGGYPYSILEDSGAPFPAGKGVWSGRADWTRVEFDLSHYQGECYFRIKFGSDSYTGGEGMYIDDVVIWSGDALAGVGPGCGGGCPRPDDTPAAFALYNALPNPSPGATTIAFAVPSNEAAVRIEIFDVMGRLTTTLVDETFDPGVHTVGWDGEDNRGRVVAPGLYFVRMQASGFSGVTKVI
ncbi:MAG: FlgD immunoglobulin-like domain containing protein, partial [bacterium]